MIFTPGDIVYSSSALINLAPPTIQYEKLQLVMEQSNVSFDDLRATIGAMAGKNVHVVGDTLLIVATNVHDWWANKSTNYECSV